MSHRRTSPVSKFSLFSFQDIITSVTGIMILVTLILALELVTRSANDSLLETESATASVNQSIEEVAAEIADLERRLESSSAEFADLPSLDETTLTEMASQLESEAESLHEDIAAAERRARELELGLTKLRTEESEHRPEEEEQLAQVDQQVESLEKKLAEITTEDRLFFTSGVKDKTVWIVEVTSISYRIGQVGVDAPPQRLASLASFEQWISSLRTQDDAPYFVVKPGGVSRFEEAREVTHNLGYDMGYHVASVDHTILDDTHGAGSP